MVWVRVLLVVVGAGVAGGLGGGDAVARWAGVALLAVLALLPRGGPSSGPQPVATEGRVVPVTPLVGARGERTLWLDEVGSSQIAVVKALRETTGCDLRTAKALTDAAKVAPQEVAVQLGDEAARAGQERLQRAGGRAHVV